MQQKLTPALVQQLGQDPASVQRLDCKGKGIVKVVQGLYLYRARCSNSAAAERPLPALGPCLPQVVGMETCTSSLTRLDLSDNQITEPDGIACLSRLRWVRRERHCFPALPVPAAASAAVIGAR